MSNKIPRLNVTVETGPAGLGLGKGAQARWSLVVLLAVTLALETGADIVDRVSDYLTARPIAYSECLTFCITGAVEVTRDSCRCSDPNGAPPDEEPSSAQHWYSQRR